MSSIDSFMSRASGSSAVPLMKDFSALWTKAVVISEIIFTLSNRRRCVSISDALVTVCCQRRVWSASAYLLPSRFAFCPAHPVQKRWAIASSAAIRWLAMPLVECDTAIALQGTRGRWHRGIDEIVRLQPERISAPLWSVCGHVEG